MRDDSPAVTELGGGTADAVVAVGLVLDEVADRVDVLDVHRPAFNERDRARVVASARIAANVAVRTLARARLAPTS